MGQGNEAIKEVDYRKGCRISVAERPCGAIGMESEPT
jgi:Pyruvate/2-oxoacid:ferredoxin oxidoreductase delta subunit